MFAAARTNAPAKAAPEEPDVQSTSASVTQMTPQLTEIFKKSLKANRWDHINLGTPEQYTHDKMIDRWNIEKNKWLNVSIFEMSNSYLSEQRKPVIGSGATGTEADVRGTIGSGPIPTSETEPTRLAVRRTMKQLSGPYSAFEQYYPLEDAIELYNEIWYESSSSDE